MKIYDLIIIGTGPAGYTASIYASRYKLDHLLIGKVIGGLASEAHKVCNFPSEESISGIDLMMKFRKNAASLGVKEVNDEVIGIIQKDKIFEIKTRTKKTFKSKTILLAIGTHRRKLNLPNEEKYIGKGVSYCATCDGPLYKDKIAAVVGGSDAANTSSLYLAQIAKKVIQIYRKDKLRGDPTWADQVVKSKKIEVLYNSEIKDLVGNGKLEAVVLQDGKKIEIDGLFIEIGSIPNNVFLKKLGIKCDKNDYIFVDEAQRTNIEGIWAAGDITTASNGFRQIITACSEGAIAANSIFSYVLDNR